MAPDRQKHLRRLEHRLATVSSWLAARRTIGLQHVERLQARLESARRELRKDVAHSAQHALASARATVEDMERDYAAPPPRPELRRDELQALKRHLELTATLLPHLSNLDDPAWRSAHEQYERSWDELLGAFEGGAAQRSP